MARPQQSGLMAAAGEATLTITPPLGSGGIADAAG
jgi:hypothetical protein